MCLCAHVCTSVCICQCVYVYAYARVRETGEERERERERRKEKRERERRWGKVVGQTDHNRHSDGGGEGKEGTDRSTDEWTDGQKDKSSPAARTSCQLSGVGRYLPL